MAEKKKKLCLPPLPAGAACFVIALALVVLYPFHCPAQLKTFSLPPAEAGKPIIITADELTWLRVENLVQFEGNVRIEHPTYVITADRVQSDVDRRIIRAYGNVVVTRIEKEGAREILRAEEVELNVDKETGWMLHSRIEVPADDLTIKFEGKRLTKIDDHTYLIEDGSFTWCQCGEGKAPDWKIEADDINADLEKDASARGAQIKLRDRRFGGKVPKFTYPISNERRTGVLMPEIQVSSADGFQIELPFYFVLSRSADATFAPRYIAERGMDLGGEFRYNYGPLGKGDVHGFGISDAKEDEPRGGIRLIHRTDLVDEFSLAADVSFISDNEVLYDFDHRNLGNENQRALESRVYASYHWDYMNLTGEFATFDDLMGGDIRESDFGSDADGMMVQRLPAVRYTMLTRPVMGPVMFDLSTYGANYYRQDMDGGQMITLLPRFSTPLRVLDAADFWFAVGYREWLLIPGDEYNSDSSFIGRPESELSVSAQWERIYEGDENVFRHSIRPELVGVYAAAPEDDPDDPFFGPFNPASGNTEYAQAGIEIVPRSDVELLGVHLDTRLWSRPRDEKAPQISETAKVEITQLYDFENKLWRDVRLEGSLGEPTPWRISLDSYYSWEETEWSRFISSVAYKFGEVAEVKAGYRYDSGEVRSPYFEFEAEEDESINGGFKVWPNDRNQVRYQIDYSLAYDQVVRQEFEWDFLAKQRCWGFNLKVSDRLNPSDADEDHDLSATFNFKITEPDLSKIALEPE